MATQLAFSFPSQPDPQSLARTAREAAALPPLYSYTADGSRFRLNHNPAKTVDWGALAEEAAILAPADDSELFSR